MNPIDYTILCLTIWREGRGESAEGRRAILHVILNRVRDPRWPNTTYGVCLQPKQFSCHNAGDPNAVKWPSENDAAWREIQSIVADPGSDPTNGSNHYHTNAVSPKWADASKVKVRIGNHAFYAL